MTNLYAALVAAQAAVQPVGKASTNTHMNYKYASGDDVVAEGRLALNGAGLALFALKSTITEHPYSWEDDKGQVHEDVQLRLEVFFRLVHSSGETHDFEPFSVPVLPEKGRPLDKAEAGARTYALSYFLRELLLIPRVSEARAGEADPDERDDRGYEPRRQKSAPKTPQRAPTQAPPAPANQAPPAPKRRSLAELIHAGRKKAEDLARQAGGEWSTWLTAEFDKLGMALLEPEQADEEARKAIFETLKGIVSKLEAGQMEAA